MYESQHRYCFREIKGSVRGVKDAACSLGRPTELKGSDSRMGVIMPPPNEILLCKGLAKGNQAGPCIWI